MYKVFNETLEEYTDDYIGRWYDGQSQPQDIALYIKGETGESWIDYDPNIGGGSSPDVYYDRVLRICLPFQVISENMAECLLTEVKTLIEKLAESYECVWDGNNHKGKWDAALEFDLTSYLNEYAEADCFFDINSEQDEV